MPIVSQIGSHLKKVNSLTQVKPLKLRRKFTFSWGYRAKKGKKMSFDWDKFRALLDETYQWPDYYEFKFIVKDADKQAVLDILVGYQIVEHPSKKGTYVSISARKLMKSSDEVIDVYVKMSPLKGVMSL